jgi:KRAB domain-containing zinc finger protein
MDVCPVCAKEVKDLKSHLKTSHGERNFICTVENCTASFTTLGLLKTHVKLSHDGLRKHTCPDCDMTFKKKSDARCHWFSTHEHKKIKCELCPTLMGSKNYYSKHIRSTHANFGQEFIKCMLQKLKDTPEEKLFNYPK